MPPSKYAPDAVLISNYQFTCIQIYYRKKQMNLDVLICINQETKLQLFLVITVQCKFVVQM